MSSNPSDDLSTNVTGLRPFLKKRFPLFEMWRRPMRLDPKDGREFQREEGPSTTALTLGSSCRLSLNKYLVKRKKS